MQRSRPHSFGKTIANESHYAWCCKGQLCAGKSILRPAFELAIDFIQGAIAVRPLFLLGDLRRAWARLLANALKTGIAKRTLASPEAPLSPMTPHLTAGLDLTLNKYDRFRIYPDRYTCTLETWMPSW